MTHRTSAGQRLVFAAASALLALHAGSLAHASCDVSPAPPAPQTCDPGGAGSESEILNCDFAGFTLGTFASVGRGGPNAATTIPRRTVFEGQASSTISNCDFFDPQDAQDLLFRADARAVVDATTFEVGVQVEDESLVRGDAFLGNLEASNAQAAVSVADFGGIPSSTDIDVVVHLTGGFQGTGGRGRAQLAVVDLEGRTLGAVFAASREVPQSGIFWRFLECPDPRSDPSCSQGAFVDRTSPFPGSVDISLKMPATTGNGLWLELKADAPLDADALPGEQIRVDFQNTARAELVPPPNRTIVMASGQSFTGPLGAEFEIGAGIDSQQFDEEFISGAAPTVRTATADVPTASVQARGTAGSARFVANTDADPTFGTQASGSLRWEDVITPSGADAYRFEFELVGSAMVGDLPSGAFPGSTDVSYRLSLNLSGARSAIGGIYGAKNPADSCGPGTLPAGGGCLRIQSEQAEIPFDISGSGDLNDGPVVIAFTAPHPMSGSWDAEFNLGAGNSYSCCGIGSLPTGRVDNSIDLGTGGNYARFLGVTSATTGGMPDTDFSIVSASAYDYSQPAPLVQALPEPGSGPAMGFALLSLLTWRRARAAG
jgi:hypothetical protein